jgi:hypothetical protein
MTPIKRPLPLTAYLVRTKLENMARSPSLVTEPMLVVAWTDQSNCTDSRLEISFKARTGIRVEHMVAKHSMKSTGTAGRNRSVACSLLTERVRKCPRQWILLHLQERRELALPFLECTSHTPLSTRCPIWDPPSSSSSPRPTPGVDARAATREQEGLPRMLRTWWMDGWMNECRI